MSAYERAYQPNEFEQFLLLILEQGNTLAILIEEYARATGVAFAMLKNKIYYILSQLEPIHQAIVQLISESLSNTLSHHFTSMLDTLDDPQKLRVIYKKYMEQIQMIARGSA